MKRIILNFVSPLLLSILLLNACQSSTTKTNTEDVDYQSITNEPAEDAITPPTQNSDQDSILNVTMDKDVIVAIETSLGIIKFKLYNETPLHKANFIKLCQNNI